MLRNRIERCNPLFAATQEPCLTITTNNLLNALSQHATQTGMITKLGLLQSGKLTLRCVIDREQPAVTSWRKTREPQSSFFHEETQHDGNSQSVVNEVIPRERSGRPDVDPQREPRPQQFVIGNDEADCRWNLDHS